MTHITGRKSHSSIGDELASVQLTPLTSKAFNPAFDVTPARFVTGLITEKGLTDANEEGLRRLYSDNND